MEAGTRAEVAALLESSQELGTKVEKVVQVLTSAGLAYKRREPVTAMLVHPKNRGGLMVQPHDAHANGRVMLEAGLRRELLEAGSVCFEMSSDAALRESQYVANERVVAAAEGMLAPVTRTERFLTVAGSHTAAFLKATVTGARAADGSSLGALVAGREPDHPVNVLLRDGWEWLIISSSVEASFPELATAFQQSYNTAHAAAKVLSEVECMQTFASLFMQKRAHGCLTEEERKDAAMEQLLLSKPACAKYAGSLAQYVLLYGGGEGERFPLVEFLACFSKVFGASMMLGEDFVRAVVATEVKGQLLPMLRCALLACQLTAPVQKCRDGFARLLLPSDAEKLRGAALSQRVAETEDCLARAWPLYLQAAALAENGEPLKAMGRLMVRAVLMLLQKQKAGREARVYANLAELSALFAKELQGEAVPAAAASGTKRSKQQPERALSLKECADPAVVALQGNKHLVLGERYTNKDHAAQVFRLVSLDAAGAVFRGQRLFEPELEVLEDLQKLKSWKRTQAAECFLCEPAVAAALQPPCALSGEIRRLRAQTLLWQHFEQHSCGTVLFAANPCAIYADKTYKAKKLKLWPGGTLAALKEGEAKEGAVLVQFEGESFAVQPVRPTADFAKASALVAFWWAYKTSDEGNLQLTSAKIAGLTVPVLTNEQELLKHELLQLKATDQGSPKKRAKKAA
ncbi:unnamed protein product [Symbiodinium sp. CCMP2592]|nr:unnamed protein product [Symbiodinium sp. CCMP2592]CAE7361107.1 unnamed protein product [Symbiodinium sp. CCMP2592]CAE7666359.1 unnamed protein product [Symbiodinium sp. CCMP2592]